MVVHARGKHRNEYDSWQSLSLFLYYRIGLWVVLASFFIVSRGYDTLETYSVSWSLLILGSMILVNFALVPIIRLRVVPFRYAVALNCFLDISGLSLLIFLSKDGISTGLPLLIVPTLSASASLLPGRVSIGFAASATVALLAVIYYANLRFPEHDPNYTLAGFIGILYFLIAIASIKIARRASESERALLERDQNLASLAEMNEQIIDRMQAGVIVVGDDGRIRLLNQSAWKILGDPSRTHPVRLDELSSDLYTSFSVWKKRQDQQSYTHDAAHAGGSAYDANFVRVGGGANGTTLIFLNDVSERSAQVQAEKLASLGRLTASIAHEIRNPLGAIQHSAQLLQEGELVEADQRLAGIIDTQSRRINRIVEDVLGLSRKDNRVAESFRLSVWLPGVLEEYRRDFLRDGNRLGTTKVDEHIIVAFDTSQLRQVLWNLLDNAQAHALGGEAGVHCRVEADATERASFAHIDVCDNGSALEPAITRQLFEPFFTSSTRGTGLGLYVSRELCLNNGGNLEYIAQKKGGACFRIKLPISTETVSDDG